MSVRTEPIWANDSFDFTQILQVGYHWPNNVSSKEISLAAFGVRHTSMPLQNGRFGLENKCYHGAQEWNTNETSSLQQLLTLVLSKKLKDPYIGTFVNELRDDSPEQLNFTAKIAQFQPHFLHLMQSQIEHSKQS